MRMMFWRLFLAFLTLIFYLPNTIKSYDIKTCWQQCFTNTAGRILSNRDIQARSDNDGNGKKSRSSSSEETSWFQRNNFVSSVTSTNLINRLGLEVQKLKDRYGSGSYQFLLDSTLSSKHGQSTEAGAIFGEQTDLLFILAVMLEIGKNGNDRGSIIVFDQNGAWTCLKGLNCLDACGIGSALRGLNVTAQGTSGKLGNVPSACALGRYQLATETNSACPNSTSNPMGIAVVNSKIEREFHRSRRRTRNVGDNMDLTCAGYSARYLVGTHSTEDKDMKYFASRSARSKYVPDDWQTMQVANSIADCMWASCCDASTPPAPLTNCLSADGTQSSDITQKVT